MPQFSRLGAVFLAAFVVTSLTAGKTDAQTIRGQWDFDAGDLAATLGLPLEYYDPGSNGHADAKTQFGTTASFGISAIGGQVAAVMKFPACLPDEGYILRTNAPANGGGDFLNQYTLIMDLLYPAGSGGYRALLQTSLTNANDADCFVNGQNGIGISGDYAGNLTAGVWHRVAVVVNLAGPTMTKYIDGAQVGAQTLSSGIDGRWALYCLDSPPDQLLLFTDDDSETSVGYINSIQFRDYAMGAAEIAALGGPSAAGIPHVLQPVNVAQWDFNGDLSATIGSSALVPGYSGPATAPAYSFTNATIGGDTAQVASFSRGTFFRAAPGLAANGGGAYVNRYTLLMDVMFPNIQPSGWAALWQTNANNTDDGEWYVRYSDHAIGISGNYGGNVTDGVWHRLGLVIDTTTGTLTSFVDGQQVQQNTDLGVDGRWALQAAALLFADDNQENAAGFVNSVQIRGYAMSALEMAQLGGPTASGIPVPAMPTSIQLTSPNGGELWQAGATQTVTWAATGADGIVRLELYDGDTLRAEIGQAVMADGQFTWQISPYVGDSTQYRVRILPSLYPTLFDVSDSAFEIYGSVPAPTTITKQPMLQDYRTDAMNLIWETDVQGGTNAVDFGIDDVTEHTITDVVTQQINSTHFIHTATIQPLEIETDYMYRVRTGTATSPTYTFRSAPRPATPIRAVWFADEQGYSIFRQQVPHMAARNPDLVLVSGDLMNDGSSLAEWQNYWFGPLEVSNLAQTIPVLFSRGNHDGEGAYAYAYSVLPGNEAWFAFTYGNTRFIFLDTNLQNATQTAWLQAQLASPEAQRAPFRVVSFHMPPYSDLWDGGTYNGEPWVRANWVPLFEQYKVDLVVSGHTHAYSRGSRNGVMYMIVGGAGNTLDTYTTYNWGFFTVKASIHHYGLMDIDRNTLTWHAYDVNDALFDTYQLTSRTPLVNPDFDADGDVDADDLAIFTACATGPAIPYAVGSLPLGCNLAADTHNHIAADLDGDGDVDIDDLGRFQRCYSGAGAPAYPHCVN